MKLDVHVYAIVGASLSEPHTDEYYVSRVYIYIYVVVVVVLYVLP